MLVCQVESGNWFQTNANRRWYKMMDGLALHNEFGVHSYPAKDIGGYDAEVTIHGPQKPVIHEGDLLEIKIDKSINPNTPFIVTNVGTGFRHRIDMRHGKFEIPFVFASTDKRVGKHTAYFKHDSGKLLATLIGKQFSVQWNANGNICLRYEDIKGVYTVVSL